MSIEMARGMNTCASFCLGTPNCVGVPEWGHTIVDIAHVWQSMEAPDHVGSVEWA